MTKGEHVTILEAARRCGVSDKTIQRAIRAGKLPAQYPQPNRCEIAVSDLERFRPRPGQVSGHAAQSLEVRVLELEQRVQELERQLRSLTAVQPSPSNRQALQAKERVTRLPPRHLVSLLAFAKLHKVAEAKVHSAITLGLLPVKRGEWIERDGTVVKEASMRKGDTPSIRSIMTCLHFAPASTVPISKPRQCPDRGEAPEATR